jgi:hypothetical protein
MQKLAGSRNKGQKLHDGKERVNRARAPFEAGGLSQLVLKVENGLLQRGRAAPLRPA